MEQWAAVGAEECMRPVIGGKWVRYDDAQRAIAEAERRVHDHYGSIQQGYLSGYEQGQRDERARIRAAVERWIATANPTDGPVTCCAHEVLAAIDAGGES